MMTTIAQWMTILSPIIAVCMAWWTIRCSAKDTAKKIAAIEESTAKQIESIKELSRLTIEAAVKQTEMEIEKYLFLAKQAQQEKEGMDEILHSGLAHMKDFREHAIKEFQEKKYERDYILISTFIKELSKFKQRLENSMKKLSE